MDLSAHRANRRNTHDIQPSERPPVRSNRNRLRRTSSASCLRPKSPMKLLIKLVGQAILPAAAFQPASRKRRLKADGSQNWLPHKTVPVILSFCITFLCLAQDPSALLQDSTVKAALEAVQRNEPKII